MMILGFCAGVAVGLVILCVVVNTSWYWRMIDWIVSR